jgi:hypothetical protein
MRATMTTHAIVSRDEWQAARAPCLSGTRHTRLGRLNCQSFELPACVRIACRIPDECAALTAALAEVQQSGI